MKFKIGPNLHLFLQEIFFYCDCKEIAKIFWLNKGGFTFASAEIRVFFCVNQREKFFYLEGAEVAKETAEEFFIMKVFLIEPSSAGATLSMTLHEVRGIHEIEFF